MFRTIKIFHFLLLFIFLSYVQVSAEKFKTFKPDNGYFTLSAPKSFQLNEIVGYGEYTAFLFDKKYDWDTFVQKGSGEFETGVSFKVEALDYKSAGKRGGELLAAYLAEMNAMYSEDGITLDFGRPEAFMLGHVDGVKFEMLQKEVYERSLLFIGIHNGYFYSLLVSHLLSDSAAKLRAEAIFDSFVLARLEDDLKKKTFKLADGSFSMDLPKKWRAREDAGPFGSLLKVSKEKMKKAGDFKTGVTVRKFTDFDSFFETHFKTNAERFSLIVDNASAPSQGYARTLRYANILTSDDTGETYIAEINNKNRMTGEYFTSLYYFIFQNSTVFQIIMKAPTIGFEKYRPVFENGIGSIVLM